MHPSWLELLVILLPLRQTHSWGFSKALSKATPAAWASDRTTALDNTPRPAESHLANTRTISNGGVVLLARGRDVGLSCVDQTVRRCLYGNIFHTTSQPLSSNPLRPESQKYEDSSHKTSGFQGKSSVRQPQGLVVSLSSFPNNLISDTA